MFNAPHTAQSDVSDTLQITRNNKSFRIYLHQYTDFWKTASEGTWEPETLAIFDRFINNDHSYIDIGSWIGPTLLYGCQMAKHAYGIEPDPVAFAELELNVALNKPSTDNVHLFNGCIAATSGKVSFGSRGDGGDSMSSLLFSSRKTSWSVAALRFEDFIKQYDIVDCNFIKMDIEGGEYVVLPTMEAYLKAQHPTLHLSLHPCFLGNLNRRGLYGQLMQIKNAYIRLAGTLRIIWCLKFYKHLYDRHGKKMSRLRLWWICRARTGVDAVFTDLEW